MSRPGLGVVGLGKPSQTKAYAAAVPGGLMSELLNRLVNEQDVVAAVERLGEQRQSESLPHLQAALSRWGLFGASPQMREVISQVEKAGVSRLGVLVTGENGTGRGLVARAIHECGVTAKEAFVSVYCHQVPPSETEELLFGKRSNGSQKRGAAGSCEVVAQGSLVHQALGGTLYFRHPEELPNRVQARLARMWRDGEVLAAGEEQSRPLQMRPVVAADLDYQETLADGRLRMDFYRRISSISITVPALRDRREDIPLLAGHFVKRACQTAGLPQKRLSPAAESVLAAVPWQGNNRQLQGLLELVVMNVAESEIDLETLLSQIRLEGSATLQGPVVGLAGTLREAKARFEREYIKAVLTQHRGRIPDAAKALGIQRTNLYRKLRALHVGRVTI